MQVAQDRRTCYSPASFHIPAKWNVNGNIEIMLHEAWEGSLPWQLSKAESTQPNFIIKTIVKTMYKPITQSHTQNYCVLWLVWAVVGWGWRAVKAALSRQGAPPPPDRDLSFVVAGKQPAGVWMAALLWVTNHKLSRKSRGILLRRRFGCTCCGGEVGAHAV